jgi:glycerol-3-phosphate O-acyltransferase/dihydroxyacetone phosphate acyltransferase
MRPLYFIFWFGLGFSFRLFFRRIKEVRPSKSRFGRTIFVSNHPSSFLDPLVVSRLRKPIVYFMTRSDVFNRFTRPLFWLAHMLPIYRQQDGGNSQEKNKKVFKKATETLARNRNLLIFGEGITDDIFERRLKPIKKGAIRIGFTALEDLDWKVEIRVQGMGLNYTNPGILRSDVLLAAAEPILLNDYKAAYLENPSKVISELNRELEQRMQAQITHVKADEHVVLHEQIMMLNRKGMHVSCYDPNISLEERWLYAQKLAAYLNTLDSNAAERLATVKEQINGYLSTLQQTGLTEAELYWFAIQKNWRLLTFLKILVQLPLFLIGLVHIALPTLYVKRFVEKKMKRPVFWSSTKMTMLLVLLPIWNILLFALASNFIALDTWVWILLFFAFNLVALGYYLFLKNTTLLIKSLRYNAQSLRSVVAQRDTVLQHLETLQF